MFYYMGLNVDFGCIHTVPNYHPKIQIPPEETNTYVFLHPCNVWWGSIEALLYLNVPV